MSSYEKIITVIEQGKNITIPEIAEEIGRPVNSEVCSAIEAMLLLSKGVLKQKQSWATAHETKSGKIIDAVTNYSDKEGKKIFKLSAALAGWDIHDYPTKDELEQALNPINGKFKLLNNAMIKRIN